VSTTQTKETKGAARKAGPVPAIQVVCATPGFRRGGQAWGPEPRVLPVSQFTEEQLEQIRAEPRLVVLDTVIEPEAQADTEAEAIK
jgi:hypothetical protein